MSEMKSSGKRMNHVFNEMVVKAGRDIDTAELQFINGGVSATFFCAQQAIHAAHAINNHDRMMEEIADLRDVLERLINPENCKKDIIHIIGSAESLLRQLKDKANDNME